MAESKEVVGTAGPAGEDSTISMEAITQQILSGQSKSKSENTVEFK